MKAIDKADYRFRLIPSQGIGNDESGKRKRVAHRRLGEASASPQFLLFGKFQGPVLQGRKACQKYIGNIILVHDPRFDATLFGQFS